jgi:hypothetical protein
MGFRFMRAIYWRPNIYPVHNHCSNCQMNPKMFTSAERGEDFAAKEIHLKSYFGKTGGRTRGMGARLDCRRRDRRAPLPNHRKRRKASALRLAEHLITHHEKDNARPPSL